MLNLGPEYPKIHTVFKRTEDRGVIMPDQYSREEFKLLDDVLWVWTEKIDGTNIRLHFDGSTINVGGRTNDAQMPTFLLGALQPLLDVARWLEVFLDPEKPGPIDVTLYGEGYGPKIHKGGGLYRDTPGFILFDVKIGRWWLQRKDVEDIAEKLGMETVPTLDVCTLHTMVNRMRLPEIFGPLVSRRFPNVGTRIEGVVGRPLVDLYDRRGDRIVAKLKVKDFTDFWRAEEEKMQQLRNPNQ